LTLLGWNKNIQELKKEALHADCVTSPARAGRQRAHLPSHSEAQYTVEPVSNIPVPGIQIVVNEQIHYLLANKILCDNETTYFNFSLMQREVGNMESRV